MAEEEEKPEEEPTPEDETEESKGLIDNAVNAVKAMKIENDRREALVKREEARDAKRQLAGQSEAGKAPVVPKEETPKEYMQRVMTGSLNG